MARSCFRRRLQPQPGDPSLRSHCAGILAADDFRQTLRKITYQPNGNAHPQRPKPNDPRGKSSRVKQSTETNLLQRLRNKRNKVQGFMNDLQVPFDNNQTEWDLRMIKMQQKISGCFRREKGTKRLCMIHRDILVVRKQGLNLIDSLKVAFGGKPVSVCYCIATIKLQMFSICLTSLAFFDGIFLLEAHLFGIKSFWLVTRVRPLDIAVQSLHVLKSPAEILWWTGAGTF